MRWRLIRLVAALGIALALQIAARPAGAQIFHPTTFRLGNGLEVVLIEDHRAAVVHHMVWYRVGSADELPAESGVAHYLEHLMFKGTPNIPPGAYSKIIAREGGRDNAFTSQDYTGYFQTIARDRLEMVMQMEAERMTRLDPPEQEAKPEVQVVLEERLMRTDNQPRGLFGEQMSAALYMGHPYGRPTIGWPSDIKALTLEKAMAFYRTYYAPNNAILIVAGDVKPADLKQLAEKHYGLVPMRPIPPRWRPPVPLQLSARRLTMQDERVTQASLSRYYLAPSVAAGEKQHAVPLDVLQEILSGATGRLYRAMVRGDGPAASAGAFYQNFSLDPTAFGFGITPKPGHTLAEVEAALDKVVADLLSDGVTEEELSDAKQAMQADTVFARDSLTGAAQTFGAALTTGASIEDVEQWPARVAQVTREQVLAAAKHVFDPRKSVTGYLEPAAKAAAK